ncbi:C-type mannose receptor 2-like isoform X1 [Sparus aurata]|nr:C-type mannose receptor 2-like isoform X1 [Sparus aurata]
MATTVSKLHEERRRWRQRQEIMEESLKKLLLFGTFLIILEVTHQTGSTYYIHEYILITHPRMSWTEAQSYCREQYGDLATISDVQVNSRIADMAKDWEEPFWIGLYEDVNSWKWSLMGEHHYTGVVEDYSQWQEDQPDNAGANEYCVSMMKDGFWRDNSCTFVKMPLICFAEVGFDQYVLVTEQKSWFEAQSYCRQHHTDLVSVRSPAENQELRSRLQADQAVQEAWIGLHKDPWKWSDGSSSSFRQWWPDQPNNENNSQLCATMHKGSWDNWTCDTEFSILCQNITEVTPAPPVEPTHIGQAVLRRTTVKMRLQTSSDLKESTIRHEILQQLEAAFHLQGLTNIKLIWRTLRPETQPTKTDSCGEKIKENLN